MKDRIIFHIDVNSAYLSWTAVRMLQLGETVEDIIEIPLVISSNIDERRGIILAKSIALDLFRDSSLIFLYSFSNFF